MNSINTYLPIIKDISTLVLSVVATTISIKTYQKAKKSILQPIRSEVIKQQTTLFTDVIELLSDRGQGLISKIDYSGIVRINVYTHLMEFGFTSNNDEAVRSYCKRESVGFLIVTDEEELSWLSVPQAIESKKKENENDEVDLSKEAYEKAKNGEFRISRIHLTGKYSAFMESISRIKKSPYLPKKLYVIIDKLQEDINTNIKFILKEVLEECFNEYVMKWTEEKRVHQINEIGVYNEFNHRSISHSHYIEELISSIRDHMRIDEEW